MKKKAFIGLGTMGYPMAGRLANAGFDMSVYNRTYKKSDAWSKEYTGNICTTPAEAAKNASIVFICVGNDDDLREVTLGRNGIIHSVRPKTIIIDHTTASAEVARELAQQLATKGVEFVDAPVSGGQAGAYNGALSIMCGAKEPIFDIVKPIMDIYSASCVLMGDIGSGQLTKMVNQISAIGAIMGLAEGMAFAQNVGLDCEKVYAAISKGAAGSWQMNNRYQTMLDDEYNHGFAIDWMRKDLAICMNEAEKNNSELQLTEMVDALYEKVQALGGGRWDTSALFKAINSRKSKTI